MKVSWRRQPGARAAVPVAVTEGGTDGQKAAACRHTAVGTGQRRSWTEHKCGTWVKVQETQSPDKERCAFQTHLLQQESWHREFQQQNKRRRQKKELRKKSLGKHTGQHRGERRRPRRQKEGTKVEGGKKEKGRQERSQQWGNCCQRGVAVTETLQPFDPVNSIQRLALCSQSWAQGQGRHTGPDLQPAARLPWERRLWEGLGAPLRWDGPHRRARLTANAGSQHLRNSWYLKRTVDGFFFMVLSLLQKVCCGFAWVLLKTPSAARKVL